MSLGKRLSAARDAFFRPQAASIDYYDLSGVNDSEGLARSLASGAVSTSGEAVSVNRAMGLSAVYAAIRLATGSVAQLPLVLNRRVGESRVPDRADKLFSLLHDRPNEWQTSFEWRELMQRDLELRGNAYSMIVRGVGDSIQELLRLHPDRVAVKQDKGSLAVGYQYSRPDGVKVDIDRRDMFHIRGMGDDGITGLSPISLHRETIGDALALRNNGSKFFSNGAKMLGVLQMPGKMNPEAQGAFREDWEGTYAGGANAHKTLLLPPGFEYKPVSMSMRDAQYLDARKFSVTDIARMFQVPPHMIADLSASTNNNIEHQGIKGD